MTSWETPWQRMEFLCSTWSDLLTEESRRRARKRRHEAAFDPQATQDYASGVLVRPHSVVRHHGNERGCALGSHGREGPRTGDLLGSPP
jgi:hypothetical protein